MGLINSRKREGKDCTLVSEGVRYKVLGPGADMVLFFGVGGGDVFCFLVKVLP